MIPPLRMPSLLLHDLCHGRSSSRLLLAHMFAAVTASGSLEGRSTPWPPLSPSQHFREREEGTLLSGPPAVRCWMSHTRLHKWLTWPWACPAVHMAPLWAPAPRWCGAPCPCSGLLQARVLGGSGSESTTCPYVIIYCKPACSGTKESPGALGGEGKADSWISSR